MTEALESADLYWHESAGARILLPQNFSVHQPFPELYANVGGKFPSLIVTVAASQKQLEMAEYGFRHLPRSGTSLQVDILWNGPISSPYNGKLLIHQIDNREHPNPSYGLQCLLYLDPLSGTFAKLNVTDFGLFRHKESMWQKILDSFSWDPAMGVALKFDGDERIFRERYTKKRKVKIKANLPALPEQLNYLQRFMNELLSLTPEEVNEDLDTSKFEKTLRKHIKGLSLEEAENQLKEDIGVLKDWLNQDSQTRSAGMFMAAYMDCFQFALGETNGLEQ